MSSCYIQVHNSFLLNCGCVFVFTMLGNYQSPFFSQWITSIWNVLILFHYQKSFGHMYVDLFLGSYLFYWFICLYVPVLFYLEHFIFIENFSITWCTYSKFDLLPNYLEMCLLWSFCLYYLRGGNIHIQRGFQWKTSLCATSGFSILLPWRSHY